MYRHNLLQLFSLLTIPLEAAAEWPGPITAAAHVFRRDTYSSWLNSPSCTSWRDLEASCESKISGITTSTAAALLSCVCLTTSSSIIFSYDDAVGSCLAYLKTASPAQFSSVDGTLGKWTTPCRVAATYASSLSALEDPRASACLSYASVNASCVAATPGFSALRLSSKASCLCYLSGGSKWAPQVFDGYLSSCLDFYHTHYTDLYSDLSTIPQTPCASFGNVRGAPSATGAEASATLSTPRSTSAPGALTTSQPRATASANYASSVGVTPDWFLAACGIVLPLIGMLHL